MSRSHKRVATKKWLTNKKEPQEHHDRNSATNSTTNGSENKNCGEHEQSKGKNR